MGKLEHVKGPYEQIRQMGVLVADGVNENKPTHADIRMTSTYGVFLVSPIGLST